jgi:hypothetical protein
MAKDRIEGHYPNDPIEIEDGCIHDVDRSLDPIGRFYRHSHMHAGVVPMVLDEFGRCAYRVKNGHWRPDAQGAATNSAFPNCLQWRSLNPVTIVMTMLGFGPARRLPKPSQHN